MHGQATNGQANWPNVTQSVTVHLERGPLDVVTALDSKHVTVQHQEVHTTVVAKINKAKCECLKWQPARQVRFGDCVQLTKVLFSAGHNTQQAVAFERLGLTMGMSTCEALTTPVSEGSSHCLIWEDDPDISPPKMLQQLHQ